MAQTDPPHTNYTPKAVVIVPTLEDVDLSDCSDSISFDSKSSSLKKQSLESEHVPFSIANIFNSCTPRKLFGTLFPAVLVHVVWWSYMGATNSFYLFENNYFMTITMIFGSLVAGATSEGGGAIAFPVMTLGFKIAPPIARDFSFMIQSVGMTAAMFSILFSRIKVELRAFLFGSLGGMGGIMIGLQFVAPHLPPPVAKILFVSIWASFATALFMLNKIHERTVHETIQDFDWKKALWLFTFGFVGGIFSSISGSGIDICVFSCLTLRFRISEKIATPTSVILMAVNTCVGFAFRGIQEAAEIGNPISLDAWNYWLVSIPVVVFGAPFGAQFASFCKRQWLAYMIYFLDGFQFIAGLVIVLQTVPYKAALGGGAFGIFVVGSLFFWVITKMGAKEVDDEDIKMGAEIGASGDRTDFKEFTKQKKAYLDRVHPKFARDMVEFYCIASNVGKADIKEINYDGIQVEYQRKGSNEIQMTQIQFDKRLEEDGDVDAQLSVMAGNVCDSVSSFSSSGDTSPSISTQSVTTPSSSPSSYTGEEHV